MNNSAPVRTSAGAWGKSTCVRTHDKSCRCTYNAGILIGFNRNKSLGLLHRTRVRNRQYCMHTQPQSACRSAAVSTLVLRSCALDPLLQSCLYSARSKFLYSIPNWVSYSSARHLYIRRRRRIESSSRATGYHNTTFCLQQHDLESLKKAPMIETANGVFQRPK